MGNRSGNQFLKLLLGVWRNWGCDEPLKKSKLKVNQTRDFASSGIKRVLAIAVPTFGGFSFWLFPGSGRDPPRPKIHQTPYLYVREKLPCLLAMGGSLALGVGRAGIQRAYWVSRFI